MAIFGPFTDAAFTANSVDLSQRVKSIQLNYSADMLDSSAMGDTTKVNLAGLLDWSITVEFIDDLAASGADSVDASLFTMVGLAAFAVSLKASSAATSTTNPDYNGNAVLAGTNIGGAHGGLLMKNGITFQSAGTLSRSTS